MKQNEMVKERGIEPHDAILRSSNYRNKDDKSRKVLKYSEIFKKLENNIDGVTDIKHIDFD